MKVSTRWFLSSAVVAAMAGSVPEVSWSRHPGVSEDNHGVLEVAKVLFPWIAISRLRKVKASASDFDFLLRKFIV